MRYPIHLPPLCERKEDIPELVKYFIKEVGFNVNGHKKHVNDVIRKLSQNHWTGNVRELLNEIRRLYATSDKSIVKMIDLINESQPQSDSDQLLNLLVKADWNQSEVARQLNVSETTIRKRIKKYNISRPIQIK